MAIIADYRVLSATSFRLDPVAGPGERTEVSFSALLPAGVVLTEGNELLLQYQLHTAVVTGQGLQIGLAVDVNGVEVGREMYFGNARTLFVQHIVATQHISASSANTIRFRVVSPVTGAGDHVLFGRVVLWFQRDANAPG